MCRTCESGAGEVTDVSVDKSPDRNVVTVSWISPETNSRCVSYQAVTLSRLKDNFVLRSLILPKEDTCASFQDLEPCVRYDVRVQPRTRDPAQPRASSKHFQVLSNGEQANGVAWARV
ncbi:hypothetical protein PR048_027374 [Dryococelus australis]|uniref:Fibronectin type-III domain-containing protein n=1 Tax=Dryococelus australis TaxID=614101 RepID=A0ABQ9GFA4_9NEOP|nr:hypothetical protein PR048_027374 [Dryococelus australis]